MLIRKIALTLVGCAAALTLAACGGGGNSSPPAPLAVTDAAFTVTATPVTIPVLQNDTPVAPADINPASVAIASQSNGTAVVNAGGTVTFTPAAGFSGTAKFTYTVSNSFGVKSNEATAFVNVTTDPGAQTWFFPDGVGSALTAAFTTSQGLVPSQTEFSSFDTSGLYYNVHSFANPGGEIRGQIIPSTSFSTDNSAGNTFSALMSGAQETPPNASKASAYGTIVLDPVANTISGVVFTSGIVGIASHIHGTALPGVATGVLFPLTGGPTVYTLPPTAITAAQIADLKAGLYYLNVHSTAAPNGELRGQLTQQLRFAALVFGNEPTAIAPAKPSSGIGVLALDLKPLANGNFPIAGFVQTTGIVNATAAHIHEGPPGVVSGVIVPITETPATSGHWVVPAGATLTPSQVASFNAGNLYYNVHTAVNPGGEIRDQIVLATTKIGNAALDGTHETPPLTTSASATGIMAVNSITKLVSGNVQTKAIAGTLSHVHEGPAGVKGNIVVPLTLAPPTSTLP